MTSEARFWSEVPGLSRSGWLTRDEPQMHPEELSTLLKITSAFSSGWEVDQILDSLYDELQLILPFDRLEYAIVDDTGYRLITHWFRATYKSKLIPVGYTYRRSQRVATEPKYRVTALDNDMPSYARHRPPEHPVSLLVAEGMKSSLSCPLIVADEVKGFLFFNTIRANGYTPHHADLIQLIAGHIAAAVEQSRLNDQLKGRNDKLQALERSRLEFIASISHELRTPLTAVVGFASEMQDRIEDFNAEELRQFAGVIAAQSSEVSGIVEDLLVITRAEAGYLTVTPSPVSVSAELKHVRGSMPHDRPDQRITLGLMDVVAWADPLRVRQIFRNLLSNAVRYGGNDVRVTVAAADRELTVVVSDDGPGVPEGDSEKVFKAYGRSNLSESKPGSIGLGLTVSRYLAEAMEGSLEYERVDDCSRFILTLPIYHPGNSRYERAT